ncbi:MAG: hypothetical protein ACRDJV_09165 [Actinomycetota bacterium]
MEAEPAPQPTRGRNWMPIAVVVAGLLIAGAILLVNVLKTDEGDCDRWREDIAAAARNVGAAAGTGDQERVNSAMRTFTRLADEQPPDCPAPVPEPSP